MLVKLRVFLLTLILPMSIGLSRQEILGRTFPVYGLAATSLRLFNSTTPAACPRELQLFRHAVDEKSLWALKILDASGVPTAGFVYGNNYWLGVKSQCLDLRSQQPIEIRADILKNNSLYRDAHKEFPPFELNYFVAYFRHTSTLQYHTQWQNEDLITLGLCLPASCTINELVTIFKGFFQERILIFADLYSTDLQLVQVKDLKDDHRWLLSVNLIITLLVMAFILSVVIAATLYDVYHEQENKVKKEDSNQMEMCRNNKKILKPIGDSEATEMDNGQEGLWRRILLCFSASKNTRLIFSTKEAGNSVKSIHGLRFLGMIWIVLIHSIFYSIDYNDNNVWTWKMSEGFLVQVISNSMFSVDSYFFISGFLLAYGFFIKQKDGKKASFRQNVSNIFLAIFRRYIRLTPAYMMVLGIVQLNGSWYERTSQFHMNERPQVECAKYWWRNLLYINNLFGRKAMCMSWSWYLSNDMQFFIIGLFLLTLSTIYFYVAASLLLLLILFSIGITAYTVYVNSYIPTLDEQYRMLDTLYDPPWTRIGPYIVGIITAYIIVRLNGQLKMHRKWLLVCWTLSSLCNLMVLFALYEKQISLTKSIIYVSLSRTAWALGLAWLLIACCTKNGGIVNTILCLKSWIPFSRLTYCAYLLNPFIISSVYLQKESTVHLGILSIIPLFLGILMMTYLSAYILSLTLESPTVFLMRKFIDEKRR